MDIAFQAKPLHQQDYPLDQIVEQIGNVTGSTLRNYLIWLQTQRDKESIFEMKSIRTRITEMAFVAEEQQST